MQAVNDLLEKVSDKELNEYSLNKFPSVSETASFTSRKKISLLFARVARAAFQTGHQRWPGVVQQHHVQLRHPVCFFRADRCSAGEENVHQRVKDDQTGSEGRV